MTDSPLLLPQILASLRDKNLYIINKRRKNGLIVFKKYHAEFAGPGAVIGSIFDEDVQEILPVGNLSLITPQNSQEKIDAYLIRRQWVRLLRQITDNPNPIQRAQIILNQFESWFDSETTEQLPDNALAMLVGVLPQTIRKVRNASDRLDLD